MPQANKEQNQFIQYRKNYIFVFGFNVLRHQSFYVYYCLVIRLIQQIAFYASKH